jgi:hypothetical protein
MDDQSLDHGALLASHFSVGNLLGGGGRRRRAMVSLPGDDRSSAGCVTSGQLYFVVVAAKRPNQGDSNAK